MMTTTTISIDLNELATIQITCNRNGCTGALQLPAPRLDHGIAGHKCPACDKRFDQGWDANDDPFAAFGRALNDLVKRKGELRMQFSVPVDSE